MGKPIVCEFVMRRPLVNYQVPPSMPIDASEERKILLRNVNPDEPIRLFLRPMSSSGMPPQEFGVYQGHIRLNKEKELQATLKALNTLARNPRQFVHLMETEWKNKVGVRIQRPDGTGPIDIDPKMVRFDFAGEDQARVLFQVGGNLSGDGARALEDEDIPHETPIPSCLLFNGEYHTDSMGRIIVDGQTFWAADWP